MLNSKLTSISPAILFALAQGFFAVHAVRAEDPPVFTLYEYVGPTGGSWFTPSNWGANGISVGGALSQTSIARNLTVRIEAPGAVAGGLFLGLGEGTGTLIVGANGSLTTSLLYPGYQSFGSLEVSSGGAVTVLEESLIGHLQDGAVTVTGAGSTFTQFTQNGGNASVGSTYNGSLTVSNNALATFNTTLNVGGPGGKTGTVLVSNGGVLAANTILERASAGTLTLNGGTLRALSNNADFLQDFAAGHATLGSSGGTIDTQSNSVTIKASIGGVGALTKTGSGTLRLSGSNTYEGGTVIRGGKVLVSADANLGAAGSLVTLDGSSLIMGTATTLTHPILITANGATIGGAGSFLGNNVTIQGAISGTGLLKKDETANLYLTGNNAAFSGGIQVVFGILVAGNSNAFGTGAVNLGKNAMIRVASGTVGNAVSISELGSIGNDQTASVGTYSGSVALNGGTLLLAGSGDGGGSLTFSGSATGTGNVEFDPAVTGSPATILVTSGLNHTGSVTNSGSLSGVTKISGVIGANVTGVAQDSEFSKLILSGNNLYTGDTTVTGGTLQIGDGGTSGSVAGNIINNGNLIFNRSDSCTYAKNISGSGSLEKQGAGTLTLSGAANYTGTTTISGGTLQFGTGGTIGSLAGNIVDNGTLIFNHSNSLNYGGVISGPGRFVKQGSGEIVLTGDNTFTGGTTVNGGTLSLGTENDAGALVSGAGVTAVTLAGGNLNLRAGSIRAGAGVDVVNATAGNGGIGVIQNSPATISNHGTLSGGAGGNGTSIANIIASGGSGGAGVAINAATTFDNHGTISGGAGGSVTNGPGFGGNGGVGVAFTSTGTLTNQGTITGGMGGFGIYTSGVSGVGVLVSGGGTLVTAPGSVIQGAPNITGGLTFGVQFATVAGTLRHQGVIVGGVLMDNLPNSVTLFTGSQIVGGPLIIGNNPAATLTLDGTGTHSLSAAVPGGIGFAGSLTKQGSGTWTIDQNFLSPGSASVAEGKLLVTGSIAGSISAASGATLGGTGRIGGSASINGTLAPGVNTGLLTFDSNLTLSPGSTTAIEIGGPTTANFDQISVDDILTYGGTLMISLLGGFEPHAGDSFQLFKEFDSQSGTFSSIAFTNPGFVGNFNYSTGTLNIVSIPEPSTGVLVSAALLGMFTSRRRLRK